MKSAVFAIAIVVGTVLLSGCTDVEVNSEDEKQFAIFASAALPQPILLNQVTGETWALTESGWQRIQELSKNGKAIDWKVRED